MKIINSGEMYSPKNQEKVIFLAGPTTRRDRKSKLITTWRKKALKLFETHKKHESLVIVIPEPFIEDEKVESQIAWEQIWLEKADKILFWVARDYSKKMYATVTNLEFGQFVAFGPEKVSYGRPKGTKSISSNDWHAEKNGIEIFDNLKKIIDFTIESVLSEDLIVKKKVVVPQDLLKRIITRFIRDRGRTDYALIDQFISDRFVRRLNDYVGTYHSMLTLIDQNSILKKNTKLVKKHLDLKLIEIGSSDKDLLKLMIIESYHSLLKDFGIEDDNLRLKLYDL